MDRLEPRPQPDRGERANASRSVECGFESGRKRSRTRQSAAVERLVRRRGVMKFGYQSYPINPSPEFPKGRLYRPMMPIRVTGSTGSINFLALLDTGADATLLPRSIGEAIGAKYDVTRVSTATGIGGEEITVHSADVFLEISIGTDRYRWRTRVGFASFPQPEEEIGILGHAGCLDLFVATFDGEEKEVELQPTKEFLRWQERSHR